MNPPIDPSNPPLTDKRLREISDKLRAIEDWMNSVLVGRKEVVRTLLLALVMKRHVLVYGPTGTGKSFMVSLLLSAIEGETSFSINLDKFTTPTAVFGPIDPKKLREDGIYMHRTENTAVHAHLLYLDEALDANTQLLRALLTLLNERKFMMGAQQEVSELITAIATTNGNPHQAKERTPDLEAVMDRFLFVCAVPQVTSEKERLDMLTIRQEGFPPCPVKLHIQEIIELNQIVEGYAFLHDGLYHPYLRIIETWEKRQSVIISARRIAEGFALLEANAILNGRLVIEAEDLTELARIFCDMGDQAQVTKFTSIALEEIKAYREKKAQSASNLALSALKVRAGNIPFLDPRRTYTLPELLKLYQEIVIFKTEIEMISVPPTDTAIADLKKRILDQVERNRLEVDRKLLELKMSTP